MLSVQLVGPLTWEDLYLHKPILWLSVDTFYCEFNEGGINFGYLKVIPESISFISEGARQARFQDNLQKGERGRLWWDGMTF